MKLAINKAQCCLSFMATALILASCALDNADSAQGNISLNASRAGINDRPAPKPSINCINIIEKFSNPSNNTISTHKLKTNYTLKTDLRSVSKSGALPSLVQTNTDNKIEFLKIFPKIQSGLSHKNIKKNPSFLEIFQSSRLAKLKRGDNLPTGITASRFFVNIYDFGFTNNNDPFNNPNDSDDIYPYFITEAIDNVTLTQLATEPQDTAKPENLGFNVKTAPKMVLESILLQIVVALKNAYSEWNLTHNDLHPGNILLSKHERADFAINYAGKKMPLAGPLIKIIDFGLGESTGYPQKTSPGFSLWVKNRPFIKELETFISHAKGDISLITRIGIYSASDNQDIVMINLILRALKHELIKHGSHLPPKTYCKSYDDCIQLMSQWWQ